MTTTEMTERDGCHNCGARMSNGLCNNPASTVYKQVGTTRCREWMRMVFTPPEWEKKR
jgi:hypothetical protein